LAETRHQLLLTWLEENPEVPVHVRRKLDDLYGSFARTTMMLGKLGIKGREQDAVFRGMQEAYWQTRVKAGQLDPGFRMLTASLDMQSRKAEEGRKRLELFGRALFRAGMRVGWLAYRLVMIGRIVLRWFTDPIRRGISLLKDWERTLVDTAFALGFLASRGYLSAEAQEFMLKVMGKLPEAGMTLQSILALLQTALVYLAAVAVSKLTGGLVRLGETMLRMAERAEPVLLPLFESINKVLAEISGLIERVGIPALESFVRGILDVVGGIVWLLGVIEPILPHLAYFIGLAAGLSPILIAIGTALYFLSPALMAAGSLLSWLATTALAPLLPILIAVVAAITAAVAVFKWLEGTIGPIPALIAAVAAAFTVGLVTFKLATIALAALGGVGAVVSPALVAVGTAMGTAGALAMPVIPIILALAAAALAVGAAFLMAGIGVKMASEGLILLLASLLTLSPAIPSLFVAAAGLTAIAAAGLTLIPAMFGLIGASAGLFALATGITALASSIMVLVAAAEAFERVGGVVEKIVGGVAGAVSWLGGALAALCFRHAIPMAKRFGETLDTVEEQTRGLTEDVTRLGEGLKGLRGVEIGAGSPGGGPEARQEITIYSTISIGTVTGVADLDLVREAANKGIAEALRRRT